MCHVILMQHRAGVTAASASFTRWWKACHEESATRAHTHTHQRTHGMRLTYCRRGACGQSGGIHAERTERMERWKERRSGRKVRKSVREREGEGNEARSKERDKRRRVRRHKRNQFCKLLGNDVWSLKAANMADLTSFVFHFGALLFLYLSPVTVSELFLIFFITTHLSTYTAWPPLFFLMPLHDPPPVCCLLAFPSSLPASLHLTYFTVSSSFQHISVLLGGMQPKVTEGGRPWKVEGWVWTCHETVHLSPLSCPTWHLWKCSVPHNHLSPSLALWLNYMSHIFHDMPLFLCFCGTALPCVATCLEPSFLWYLPPCMHK